MPVLFVHGVAVRNEDDPQFSVVERLTRGAEWPVVEELLRTHVAPELNRADPDAVDIARVYWGDLGARHHADRGDRVRCVPEDAHGFSGGIGGDIAVENPVRVTALERRG